MSWGWYERRPNPRPVGGIKARNKRGDFGETWWGRRWTQLLYELGMGERLQRGRTYARTGRVLSIDTTPGLVRASVQGSFEDPYQIEIRLREFSEAQRAALAEALASDPLLAARLLAGELPEALEPVCAAAGMPLFPAQANDLRTKCDCYDWANPCKHIAAVYCLLAEAFDDNPFLILTLRGVSREALSAAVLAEAVPLVQAEPEPLPADPAAFWHTPPLPPEPGPGREPALPAALLHRLGPVPFWRGQQSLLDSLEPVYRQASRAAFRRPATGGAVEG